MAGYGESEWNWKKRQARAKAARDADTPALRARKVPSLDAIMNPTRRRYFGLPCTATVQFADRQRILLHSSSRHRNLVLCVL